MVADPKAIDATGLFDGYSNPEYYNAPEADKELVGKLNAWRETAKLARQPWERQIELNRHYLRGDQLLARNKLTGDIVRLSPEDSRRLKSQNNVLLPTARSLIGKLAKMIPTYVVDPATTDFEEQHGARTATNTLQFVRAKEDLDRIYAEACEYLPWAGNSFIEVMWDKMAGRKIAFCPVCNFFDFHEDLVGAKCPQCTSQRQQELEMRQERVAMLVEDTEMAMAMGQELEELPPEIPQTGALPHEMEIPELIEAYEGDVRVAVRDPRNVYIPSGCLDIRRASRVCVRELMEVAEARARFPQFAAFIQADSRVKTEVDVHFNSTTMGSQDAWDDHVFVDVYHERPTEAYPRGRVITVVNDLLVDESESPYYKLGRVPLFHFGFDRIPGEFYNDAFITQAWHRQKELNLLESQLREHIDLVLRPKLLTPVMARISAEEFNADSAQVVTYSPAGGTPNWLVPPPLPSDVWGRKSDLMQDIRMDAAVTESEQGVSGANPNGRAMAIINAESDQQVGPIMSRNNSEWRELHRAVIILYQCYAHPERIASVAGSDGSTVILFEDLNLLQSGWDIRMEQEEGLSRNPQIRLQQALELNSAGFFLDPSTGALDKKAFARYAKLRVPEAGYDAEASERAAASQIPYLIQRGQMWTPRTFDIPQIFMEELGGWLRGPGRRADPMLVQQVEQIWQYYTMWASSGQMGPAPDMGGEQAGPEASMPNGGQSQPGGNVTAPGGTPGGAGGLGTQANQQVQAADYVAEGNARLKEQGY